MQMLLVSQAHPLRTPPLCKYLDKLCTLSFVHTEGSCKLGIVVVSSVKTKQKDVAPTATRRGTENLLNLFDLSAIGSLCKLSRIRKSFSSEKF